MFTRGCCRDAHTPMLSSDTLEPPCSPLEVLSGNCYKHWSVILVLLLVLFCANLLHFMWQSHQIREVKPLSEQNLNGNKTEACRRQGPAFRSVPLPLQSAPGQCLCTGLGWAAWRGALSCRSKSSGPAVITGFRKANMTAGRSTLSRLEVQLLLDLVSARRIRKTVTSHI